MPVFYKDNKRVLFVHVPKCGGSYIEHLFLNNGFSLEYIDGGKPGNLNYIRKCSPQHMHSEMLNTIFELSKFDFIFTVVREPVQRIISEAHMRLKESKDSHQLDTWVRDIFSKYTEDNFILDNHIRPQSEFLCENIHIFKQEDGFGEDFISKLEEKIGFTFEVKNIERVMGRSNFTKGNKFEFLPETQNLIKQFYQVDYEGFGYEI